MISLMSFTFVSPKYSFQVFGASDAKDILGCSDSTARAVIAKLRDEIKVIVAVKGQGKGKYRFINK